MNNKGQMSVGIIIIVAVTLIVGAIFLQAIAQEVGSSTNTVTVNSSKTLAANGASIYITEYKALSGVTVVNASNQSQVVPSTNYTVTNNVINPTTGALSVKVTTNTATWGSKAVYIRGTGQPLTYISDSGGRAMASLIVVLFAMAVLVVALSPTLQSKLLDAIGR